MLKYQIICGGYNTLKFLAFILATIYCLTLKLSMLKKLVALPILISDYTHTQVQMHTYTHTLVQFFFSKVNENVAVYLIGR